MPTSGGYQSAITETGLSQATKGQTVDRCSKCPRETETTDELAGQHNKFLSSASPDRSVVRWNESRVCVSKFKFDLTARLDCALGRPLCYH